MGFAFGFWEFGAVLGSNLLKWHSLRAFFLTLLRPRLPLFFSFFVLAFPPHFVGLECCCFWFCFRNTTTPFLFFFSHLSRFWVSFFVFLFVWLCLSSLNRERCPTPWLNKQAKGNVHQKHQGKGRWEGKQGAGGGPRKTTHKRRVAHVSMRRIEQTKIGMAGGKEGVLRGSKEKRNQIGTREQKNPNFEHSKGNTSRVAWCGIRRSESHRVTFQFISPSMLIASTVFWFILFCGYVLFQHLAPLFECVLPFFFLHSKPGKPHLNLLASALSSRFLVSQSLLFFAHGFFLGR